jgi:hypothetical protein
VVSRVSASPTAVVGSIAGSSSADCTAALHALTRSRAAGPNPRRPNIATTVAASRARSMSCPACTGGRQPLARASFAACSAGTWRPT